VTSPPGASTNAEAPLLFAGRYEVLGLLGGGAMGTVYRARDRELDELVALKVLRKDLAASPGMLERFRREVKLARRVTHRNVARTFDIGEEGGERFLTMELVAGEMLGARLARAGRFTPSEALATADEVCAGLSAAHAAGVLHRDLKPENVIVATDGRIVITDFGIARAVSDGEGGRTLGGVVGTPAYMAPEQVEGAQDLDARADLYALGVMLYELLTGGTPWTGDSIVAVAAARLLRPPPDPSLRAPELPSDVRDLVMKLMARSRDDRFATADEVRAAIATVRARSSFGAQPLEQPVTAPRSFRVGERTVAVLPMLNLGAAEDAYLATVMVEDIVDQLSVVPGLRVRPRGETARFDEPSRDVREVGRALGVDVVVDASLRRLGDAVRIAVRLVTVEDGFQLWARRFDRAPTDVLAIVDDAASAIAHALAAERSGGPARRSAGDPRALELYLRARAVLNKGWWEHGPENLEMLNEAHRLAPDDARIAGTLALGYARGYSNEAFPKECAREARAAAATALSLEPNQPEALVATGLVHLSDSEGTTAIRQLHRAVRVAPNSLDALEALGRMLVEVGRVDDGLGYLRHAVAIEPTHSARFTICRVLTLIGDDEAAEEMFGPEPAYLPEKVARLLTRGRTHLWRGEGEKAVSLLSSVPEAVLPPGTRKALGSFFTLAARAPTGANRAEIEKALPVDDSRTARRACFNAQLRTEFLLAGNDLDGALENLRYADANGLLDLVWIDHCPLLAKVRDRPELAMLRSTTAARAKRVLDALDAAVLAG
jgi:serine/threonine-protein kinase